MSHQTSWSLKTNQGKTHIQMKFSTGLRHFSFSSTNILTTLCEVGLKTRTSENRAESLVWTIPEIDHYWNVKAYCFKESDI